MSLIQTLRASQLEARKARNEVTTNLLTALIGEALRVGKDAGNRESTDAEVAGIIRKFLKNAEETRDLLLQSGRPTDVTDREIEILKSFAPQQMSEPDIRLAVEGVIARNPEVKMGDIMASLKENFGGRYDGKMASAIVKSILAG